MDIQAPIPAYSPVTSPQQVGCDPRAIYTQPEQPPAANEYNFSSVFTPSSDVDQSQSPEFEDGSGESEKTDSDDGEFPAPRGRSRPVVVPSQVTSTEEPSGDFRPPRTSRLSAPIPVPNLTKKSRGRRVPTTSVVLQNGVTKNARMYMCSVAGCGKCFARGEHLKRHVRSIHTHEKPHKCPHSSCGKEFSRHDNLCQHMRVHRSYSAPRDGGYA
ncbi:hypothetical protein SISSUDRAFT_979852 [Sistotremastrum suecicum HHB10207 ss-3]|nr:hypothetical protein SISSUDRAFT_979852 [Sistotremastrum suecicum HHB10207 ss-3]